MTKRWYAIHTQTGHEDRVKTALDGKVEQGSAKDFIFQILIPTEKVSEVKAGKKTITQRKFFPGYVLVEMELNNDSWYVIKSTPGVSGFIGSGKQPLPLKEEEIAAILKEAEDKKEKPIPKVVFEKGESVKIIEGPFTNFHGIVEEINPNRGKLKVMVNIFGRATPVELEYWQVERV